MKQKVLII